MRSLHLILTSLLLMTSALVHAESTEIQMFVNYRGTNHYSSKIVSTFAMPTSAFYVYVHPGEVPSTAACYRGEPAEAIKLFKEMVRIFNVEYHRMVRVNAVEVEDSVSGGRSLHIDGYENGRAFSWFPEMGRCWRHSSESERHPTF